jgi:CheY-like chemotaxis protein
VRILVIDDEPDLRELYSENLKDAGHDVVTACNGQGGLGKLGWRPDLILLDLMMPVMDGYEFLDRLRRTPGYERTPTIVVSASPARATRIPQGATAFVGKPFDTDNLLQIIERHST